MPDLKPTSSPPAPRATLHEKTLAHLGAAIVARRFTRDKPMPPEALLSAELGVSRTVMREAVKSLVAKGLVTTGPKVGTRVTDPECWNWFDPDVVRWQRKVGLSPEFLRDVQELRQLIEPAAARMAALRATPADVAALEEAYAGMVQATQGQGDYVQHDLRFHQGLLRASHNRMVAQMSEAVSALLRITFEIATMRPQAAASSLLLHRRILDAVTAGRAERAEKAVLALLASARDDMNALLAAKRKVPGLAAIPRRRGSAPATTAAPIK